MQTSRLYSFHGLVNKLLILSARYCTMMVTTWHIWRRSSGDFCTVRLYFQIKRKIFAKSASPYVLLLNYTTSKIFSTTRFPKMLSTKLTTDATRLKWIILSKSWQWPILKCPDLDRFLFEAQHLSKLITQKKQTSNNDKYIPRILDLLYIPQPIV